MYVSPFRLTAICPNRDRSTKGKHKKQSRHKDDRHSINGPGTRAHPAARIAVRQESLTYFHFSTLLTFRGLVPPTVSHEADSQNWHKSLLPCRLHGLPVIGAPVIVGGTSLHR